MSYTFKSTFMLLEEFAGLHSEISNVVPYPDDVLILGLQRNSTVLVEHSRADSETDCSALPLSVFFICEIGSGRG